jgi:hypothetical protein
MGENPPNPVTLTVNLFLVDVSGWQIVNVSLLINFFPLFYSTLFPHNSTYIHRLVVIKVCLHKTQFSRRAVSYDTMQHRIDPIEIFLDLEQVCWHMSFKHFGRKKPCKKSADLHPRQGNLLHWNIFTGLNQTSLLHKIGCETSWKKFARFFQHASSTSKISMIDPNFNCMALYDTLQFKKHVSCKQAFTDFAFCFMPEAY